MGNTNSSPRYRSRSPDPSSLDQTWNNSYPKAERERSNRSQWQQQQQQAQHHQQQQHQPNQAKQKHSSGGYPASSASGSGVMVNGHLNSAHYDQFEQECIQHQQQQQQQNHHQSKLSDQQPLRFARCVKVCKTIAQTTRNLGHDSFPLPYPDVVNSGLSIAMLRVVNGVPFFFSYLKRRVEAGSCGCTAR